MNWMIFYRDIIWSIYQQTGQINMVRGKSWQHLRKILFGNISNLLMDRNKVTDDQDRWHTSQNKYLFDSHLRSVSTYSLSWPL